jgi:chromate reductase, NAD(P)H dehydrogenase (quinone)
MSRLKVAVIVGSNRRESINRKLAKALVRLIGDRSEAQLIRIDDLPMYNLDLEPHRPETVNRFTQEVASADALLVVTPEFNRSLPAVLKNAIDWGSKPMDRNVWKGQSRSDHGHIARRNRDGRRPATFASDPRRARQPGDRRRSLHHLQAGFDRRR